MAPKPMKPDRIVASYPFYEQGYPPEMGRKILQGYGAAINIRRAHTLCHASQESNANADETN
jgi:hypothetical protein